MSQLCPRCLRDLPPEDYAPSVRGVNGTACRTCKRFYDKSRRLGVLPGLPQHTAWLGLPRLRSGAKAAPRDLSERYLAFHRRLTVERGRARDMKCAHCDRKAAGWSYDHSDPNPMVDLLQSGRSAAYSLDVRRYDPLCRRCHATRDADLFTEEERIARRRAGDRRRAARGDGRVLTSDEIAEVQVLLDSGIPGNQIARKLQMSSKRVYNIRDRGAPKLTNLSKAAR